MNATVRTRKKGTDSAVDLNDVAVFVRVVEAGSFTKAAAEVGLPKSAISRRVVRLENTLGVRLLQRTTRSLHLTAAGNAYFERAKSSLQTLSEARDLAADTSGEARGAVRISAPLDVGTLVLSPLLARFAELFPNVFVDVDLSNRQVDLVSEGIDLAVRAGPLRETSLVARRLGETRTMLVASPAYIARRGLPKNIHELASHDCVLWRSRGGTATWTFESDDGMQSVEVTGRLGADDFAFVRQAAIAGAGIALVPTAAAASDIESGALTVVLPGIHGPTSRVHLVYPSARFLPQRVAALRDFLLQEMHLPDPCKLALVKAAGRKAGPEPAAVTRSAPTRAPSRVSTGRTAKVVPVAVAEPGADRRSSSRKPRAR